MPIFICNIAILLKVKDSNQCTEKHGNILPYKGPYIERYITYKIKTEK